MSEAAAAPFRGPRGAPGAPSAHKLNFGARSDVETKARRPSEAFDAETFRKPLAWRPSESRPLLWQKEDGSVTDSRGPTDSGAPRNGSKSPCELFGERDTTMCSLRCRLRHSLGHSVNSRGDLYHFHPLFKVVQRVTHNPSRPPCKTSGGRLVMALPRKSSLRS